MARWLGNSQKIDNNNMGTIFVQDVLAGSTFYVVRELGEPAGHQVELMTSAAAASPAEPNDGSWLSVPGTTIQGNGVQVVGHNLSHARFRIRTPGNLDSKNQVNVFVYHPDDKVTRG